MHYLALINHTINFDRIVKFWNSFLLTNYHSSEKKLDWLNLFKPIFSI